MKLVQARRTPHAYAVLDEEGTLTFCRSSDSCGSGQLGRLTDLGGTVREGTIFIVPEKASPRRASAVPWLEERGSIKAVTCAGERVVAPRTTSRWFDDMGNLASADLSGIDISAVWETDSMFEGCPPSLATIGVGAEITNASSD